MKNLLRYMKAKNFICVLCLLIAGMGTLSAGSPKKVKADKYGVKESVSAELLSKKMQEDGKVTFKCRITRYKDQYTMLAKVLKNDSTMHIVHPGVKFALTDGDSVVLKAERPAACCSSWADGRWYNVSFKLGEADVEKLKNASIFSVTIPYYGGETGRRIAPGKENSVAELLQSLDD